MFFLSVPVELCKYSPVGDIPYGHPRVKGVLASADAPRAVLLDTLHICAHYNARGDVRWSLYLVAGSVHQEFEMRLSGTESSIPSAQTSEFFYGRGVESKRKI